MRVAVLSDIHSNYYALQAVLKDCASLGLVQFYILGDLFGYYPWAEETYNALRSLDGLILKGNHDLLVSGETECTSILKHERVAEANRSTLAKAYPEAIDWLRSLPGLLQFSLEENSITLCHGTPADVFFGRLYPDDVSRYPWLPGPKEILFLGHTHHPMARILHTGGKVFNPGSVGQPRDGDPRPSWGIFDSSLDTFELQRSSYDLKLATSILSSLGWDDDFIRALERNLKREK